MRPIADKTIPQRPPKPEKVEAVRFLSDLLDRSSGTVLTDYRGLTVAEKADLTRRLRAVDAEFHVVKNTLFRRAYDGRGEDPGALLAGPTAVAFALGDPVAPTKVLLDFLKEKRKGAVRGAVLDGRLFDADAVARISKLPPRQQLLGELVGSLQSPVAGLVFTLQGVMGNFVRTLQAIHDQKAGSAG